MKKIFVIATMTLGMMVTGSAFAFPGEGITINNDNSKADHDINAVTLNGGIATNNGLVIDKSVAVVSHAGVGGKIVDIGGNTSANGVGNTNVINGVQVVNVTLR